MHNYFDGSGFDLYSMTLFPDYMRATEPFIVCEVKPVKHKDLFHLVLLDGVERTTDFDMPILTSYTETLPATITPFPDVRAMFNKKCVDYTTCPHFYVDDKRFNCILNDIDKYVNMLKGFPCVIGPDLSINIDMPEPIKMVNVFYNKLISRYYQLNEINVIPNVVWAEPESYGYCFSGFPSNSVIAVNSSGIKGNPNSVFFWMKGYNEMLERLKPTHILRYGERIPGENETISTFYPNNHINRMRHVRL